MANGRQRRLAARKKIAERARINDGLAGLNPSALTNIVSDDNNDLDEVSFTTSDGAKVSMQNQRGKNEEGKPVTPTKRVMSTADELSNLNAFLDPGRDSDHPYDNVFGVMGASPAQGGDFEVPGTDGKYASEFFLDDLTARRDALLAQQANKQPSAITDFIGEDLSMPESIGTTYGGGATQMGNLGTSYSGGPLQDNKPNIDSIGTTYGGGPTQMGNLGTTYGGGSTFTGYPEPEWDPAMPQDAFDKLEGNYMANNPALPENADIVAAQMNRNAGFDGSWDDIIASDAQTNAQGINNIGTSYSGGPLQETPDAIGFPDQADKARAQAEYDKRLAEEDMAAQMRGTRGVSFSGGPLQNGPKVLTNREKFNQQKINERKNAEAVSLFEDLKSKGFNPTEPVLSTDVSQGFEETTHQGTNSAIRGDLLAAEAEVNDAKAGVEAGILTKDAVIAAEEKLVDAKSAFNKPLDFPEEEVADDKTEIPAITDPLLTPEGTPVRQGAQTLEEAAKAAGAVYADGTIDQDWVDSQFPDDYTARVAHEAEKADSEIIAETAGDPEAAAIVTGVKENIGKLKEAVESGATTIDEAKEAMSSSFGQIGELLGIDKKDLVRALFRFGGAIVFGSSANAAAKFAYDGWVTDNSDTVLGKDATAKQRNLAAYNKEVKTLDAKVAAGQMTQADADAQKKIVDQVYGVNKKQTMGRPVNIKGINSQTGAEEVVAGRRNENNSYDVFLNGQWMPVEEAGLQEIQITGRGAEQAFEKGYKDPRSDKHIDNATYVSSTGVPTFAFKTGDARKAYQLAKRSVDSFPVIESMMSDPKNVEKLTSALGGLQAYAAGNANAKVTAASINLALGDELPQKFKSATSAWLQALLRADTGAAYSETEIMDYISTNIPQVGDKPETVQFKLQQMKSTTETMAANATQGSKYLLGRLDGSIEAPDAVKKMHDMAKPKTTTTRSTELQSALDLY